MGLAKEFKEFALKGSVIDLAVGVIIGGAFNKIVNSFVEDIITPLILNPALKAANLDNLSQLVVPGTAIKYGNFVSICISFIIIAFCLFMIIKGVNRMRRSEKQEEKAPTQPTQEELLTQIRDLLKEK